MKKDPSGKRKMILTIGIIVGTLLAVIGTTAAIYTSQVYQRSVVRNRNNDVICFSSDKLYRVVSGTSAQEYYYPLGKGQTTMSFQVCNYDQAKDTLFNDKKIEYTVDIVVENGTHSFNYYISGSSGTTLTTNGTGNGSVSFDGSLQGGKRSANTYTLSINEEDYSNIKVKITVTPKDLSVTQNRILNGILIPVEHATTQGVTVRKVFTDSTRDNPNQFVAYNLLVSISGDVADVLIKWDHTKLDIDPFFAAGKTTEKSGNITTITVPMNPNDETGTYLIQFYNHTGKENWISWDVLDQQITVELAKTENNT